MATKLDVNVGNTDLGKKIWDIHKNNKKDKKERVKKKRKKKK